MALLTAEQRQTARTLIRRYCEKAELNKGDIHYSQRRPMTHLGVPPSHEFTADCSGFATGAYKWADKYTAFKVRDPNGDQFDYNGYGYTGTLLAANRTRRVTGKYMVGDMALYGTSLSNTTHVCICRSGGNAGSSIWTSHGSEAGPYAVRLNYRSDLLLVVRGRSLAA
jgi:hypothetical protein